jgi:hypothetical protein
MKVWMYDPNSGGKKIPPTMHDEICKQVQKYACARTWYPKIQLKVRFKNQFCYIDTISEGDERVFPLCRLRNKVHGWSLALSLTAMIVINHACFQAENGRAWLKRH